MFIDFDILITWGAVAKKYRKGEYIFQEGDHPNFYFQIIEGKVKLINTNYDGREFTQGEFEKGESFGEPLLFIDELYPSTAITVENSIIVKLSKNKFFDILEEYPMLQKKLLHLFAKRIFNKSSTIRDIVNNTPEERILAFLNYYKKKVEKEKEKVEIPYTRQEIANYTGLRVETVIRALIKMKSAKTVDIVNRKLIY